MTKKNKIIYSLGLIGIAIPIATIISCGESSESEDQEKDQKKLNAITSEQVAKLLEMKGDTTKYATATNPSSGKPGVTINDLKNVNIDMNDKWDQNDVKGEIKFSITARKSGLTDHIVNVTVGGYNKDQGILNAITSEDIKKKFGWTGNDNELPAEAAKTIDIVTKPDEIIGGLEHINISVNNVNSDNNTGKMTLDVQIKHANLDDKNLVVELQYKVKPAIDPKLVLFQAITVDQVLVAMDHYTSDEDKWTSDAGALPEATYDPREINGVAETSIAITDKTTDDDKFQGQAVFDVTLSNTLISAPPKIISNVTVSGFMVELDANTSSDSRFVNRRASSTAGKYDTTILQVVTKIAANTFNKKELLSVAFEANSHLLEIGQNAFSTSVESGSTIVGRVELPNSLKTIGEQAFFAAKINVLTFGNQLETISMNAFRYSTIKSLTIPSSVIRIGDAAFYASPITYLKFEGDVPSPGGRILNIIPDESRKGWLVFKITPINSIQASSSASAQEWQDWGKNQGGIAGSAGQFKS